MYVVTRDDLYLVPTAEVPVTNIHRDEIIEAARLPIRYVAYSPCFRREAGAAGAKTRGILRVHQFDKVEMVAFTRPEESAAELEWMTWRAEAAAAAARAGLSRAAAVDRRHGLHAGEDVRPRGLGARRGGVAGGHVGLELPRFPGAPDEHPLATRSRARSRRSCTRSTARAWRFRERSPRCSRSTSSRTAQSRCPSRLLRKLDRWVKCSSSATSSPGCSCLLVWPGLGRDSVSFAAAS